MQIRLIDHGSSEYAGMVELRTKVLRQPLGLSFTPNQLAKERQDLLVCAFERNEIIGCCILTRESGWTIRLRQMAVRPDRQGRGVGMKILRFAESLAMKEKYTAIIMHARDTAIDFYRKSGYEVIGRGFKEVGIPHHTMQKKLHAVSGKIRP